MHSNALHCGTSTAPMSALGQKQTQRHNAAMSALPPKADIDRLPCPLCANSGQCGRYRDEGRVIGRTWRIYAASAAQKFWA